MVWPTGAAGPAGAQGPIGPIGANATSPIPRKTDPAMVLIGVGFRTEGRHLVIYANPRKAGRFVAGAVRTNDDGTIEDFTLKVWAASF